MPPRGHGPTIVVLLLLTATALAFVTTQRQKLERSPIVVVSVDRVLSPVCRCKRARATMRFRLRRPDRMTLDIVSASGVPVRRLADGSRLPRGPAAFSWDGRDDAGRRSADGVYRPQLNLASGARTFVLPNEIRLDTVAPRLTAFDVIPDDYFSPGGDGRNDRVTVRYAVDEPAHGLLFVNGRREVRTRFPPLEGRMRWFGLLRGRPLPAGRYRLEGAAEDVAGNVGPARAAVVEIRYISLARPRLRALARTRFGVRVTTDARRYRWSFAGGTGTARPGLLVLRAPRRPGRYTLFVAANGRGARASVVVRRRQPSRSAAARSAATTMPTRGQTR